MSGPTLDSQLSQVRNPEGHPAWEKAVVVGIYGVPGSGKTFLLDQLKQELKQDYFAFYEGSMMIDTVVPGGLDAFRELNESEKVYWRQLAIEAIGNECAQRRQVAIVAGHFMFWPEEEDTGLPVYTPSDFNTFTHILYLNVPAEVITQRRLNDTERSRPTTSANHLREWQQTEIIQLRDLCFHHSILFSLISLEPTSLNKLSTLLRDFRLHTEMHNLSCAEMKLDEALVANQDQLETVLVMDADKTLAAEDTGTLFWQKVSSSWPKSEKDNPLDKVFSSPMGYSYTAFRQATLLYEEAVDDEAFDAICQNVASAVTMYAEFVSLLHRELKQPHTRALVVTCGLRRVWEKVLETEGLSETVKVLGGGRISDGFVVTAAVKASLVARLRDTHKLYVWAFGDSPLDLEMLSKADQAIVVVGEEQTRSRSMETALMNAIDNEGLEARQVVFPSNAQPRLDITKLPVIQLTDEFMDSILCRQSRRATIKIFHTTNRNAAKLLMTQMRDANIAGPVLREAHRRVGWYLATEIVGDLIGTEEYQIPHVQGHYTSGHRLLDERRTSIVALMRGGEPMALGVSDAFPLSMFIHASRPNDIMLHHLQDQRTILLVDSVINSGKTVVQFVQRVRNLHATIRIVVITGVAQAQSISGEYLARALSPHKFTIVALRLSDNSFSGRGTTDTGNRLFNTTHLD